MLIPFHSSQVIGPEPIPVVSGVFDMICSLLPIVAHQLTPAGDTEVLHPPASPWPLVTPSPILQPIVTAPPQSYMTPYLLQPVGTARYQSSVTVVTTLLPQGSATPPPQHAASFSPSGPLQVRE